MKELLVSTKDNLEILIGIARDFPKVTITIVAIIATLTFGLYLRGGDWFNCYKNAWYEQNVSFDNFDFKSLTGVCVVKRGDRWVPIDRVVDAGDITSFE